MTMVVTLCPFPGEQGTWRCIFIDLLAFLLVLGRRVYVCKRGVKGGRTGEIVSGEGGIL